MTARALTFLNETGDTTIMWEADNDERMQAIIEKKMAEGFTFSIIEPRMGGIVPPDASKPLKKFKDATKHRALSMRDEDFERMVADGAADLVKTPAQPVKTVRKAKNAGEVAKAESVAVRPARGG